MSRYMRKIFVTQTWTVRPVMKNTTMDIGQSEHCGYNHCVVFHELSEDPVTSDTYILVLVLCLDSYIGLPK